MMAACQAAYHGRTSAVVLLLNARVDVFHADNEGRTALHKVYVADPPHSPC